MSSIKKNTTKSTKSPTPATKSAKPATKPAAKSSSKPSPQAEAAATASIVAAVARAAAPAVVETPAAPTPAAPVVKSSNAKTAAVTPATTTITARVNVGFGNSLYLRGDAPDLSWDRGILMTCIGSDLWQARLVRESSAQLTFKFLINDITWSSGADHTIATGANETFVPQF